MKDQDAGIKLHVIHFQFSFLLMSGARRDRNAERKYDVCQVSPVHTCF